jgi:hypothetical protein
MLFTLFPAKIVKHRVYIGKANESRQSAQKPVEQVRRDQKVKTNDHTKFE